MDLRKSLFRLCLEVNSESQADFARRNGVSPMAVSRFLCGYTSEPMRKRVDQYISSNLHKIKDRLDEFTKAA